MNRKTPRTLKNMRSNAEVAKPYMDQKEFSGRRVKAKSRPVRSFHPNTISIPATETIGVLEGKITYTEVIDAVTGDVIGIPNMDVVRETMRPSNDPNSRDGEYYISNFRTEEEQAAWEQEKKINDLGMTK